MKNNILTMLHFTAAMMLVSCAGTGIQVKERDLIRETIAPGKIHEDCMKAMPGQEIVYAFESTMPLDFNIHYHENNRVVHGDMEMGATKREGRYRAPIDQHYCLMWTNPNNADVLLSYRYSVKN